VLSTQPRVPRQAKHAASLQTASEEAARLGETLQQWQAECAEAGAERVFFWKNGYGSIPIDTF